MGSNQYINFSEQACLFPTVELHSKTAKQQNSKTAKQQNSKRIIIQTAFVDYPFPCTSIVPKIKSLVRLVPARLFLLGKKQLIKLLSNNNQKWEKSWN